MTRPVSTGSSKESAFSNICVIISLLVKNLGAAIALTLGLCYLKFRKEELK